MRYIKSLKLSLALLVILLPLIAIGNLVPQKGRFSPAYIKQWRQEYPAVAKVVDLLGLDHLYTTWWFLLLFGVLFLNMSLITWDLLWRTYRKSKGMHRFTGEAPRYLLLQQMPFDGQWLMAFERVLRKRRYALMKVGGEIYARKGWVGIWGGTILHVGLVVILSGAVVSGLFRFNGYAELGEGQHMFDSEQYYISMSKGVLFPGHKREVAIQLKGVQQKKVGRILHTFSTVTVTDGKEATVTKTLRMNEPLKFKGLKIYQARVSGPSLLFRISSPTGMGRGYVNMEPFKGDKTQVLFSIPGTPFQAKAVYQRAARAIEIEVRRTRELLYRGPLRIGQTVSVDRDTTLTLEAIKRWVGLIVVYDPGVPVVFTGFALSVLGVAIMAVFDPREIWVRIKDTGDGKRHMEVLGWGRWKNMFMDEYQQLSNEVQRWIS